MPIHQVAPNASKEISYYGTYQSLCDYIGSNCQMTYGNDLKMTYWCYVNTGLVMDKVFIAPTLVL